MQYLGTAERQKNRFQEGGDYYLGQGKVCQGS